MLTRKPIRIPVTLLSAMLTQCVDEAPTEACGVLSGPQASPDGGPVRLDRWTPMRNIRSSPDAYGFDSDHQLDLYLRLDAQGDYPWVVYHSHTVGWVSEPSMADRQLALDPRQYHLIVSTSGVEWHRAVFCDRLVQATVAAAVSGAIGLFLLSPDEVVEIPHQQWLDTTPLHTT